MDYASLPQIITSIVTSFVAGILLIKYAKYRENKIKREIAEIQEYEGYIHELGEGSTRLLRTSFAMGFVCMGGIAVAFMLFIWGCLLKNYGTIQQYLWVIASSVLIATGYFAFRQFKAIYHSANIEDARQQFAAKREKLSSKLS